MTTVTRSLVLVSVSALALASSACGSKSNLKATGRSGGVVGTGQTGGSPGGTGGKAVDATGGQLGSGGAPSTGDHGSGGVAGGGGGFGFGGAASSAGFDGGPVDVLPVSCHEDGGQGLPAAARQCTQDADCTIAVLRPCCGMDIAYGEAKVESSNYAACVGTPTCDGLGCARLNGVVTDTGRSTIVAQPLEHVAVRCSNHLCTTYLLDEVDAGIDTTPDAPSADAAPDAIPPCGDATCGPRQVCVLIGGGPVPLCVPTNDAGICDPQMVRVDSCSVGGGPTHYQPGCTTPPPSPSCRDFPDACSDVCSCVCGMSAAPLGGCLRTGAYYTCSYP
jgi:hypothetical protein